MLNLQEFVTEALVQVVEGVRQAQERVAPSGAMINPVGHIVSGGEPTWHSEGFGTTSILGQIMEFDVAVEATENKDIKGGIGVVSGVFNGGYKAGKGTENSSVSRVKFTVPVFLPNQMIDYELARKREAEQIKRQNGEGS